MTEKDLKKLNRAELLELLIVQTQENERLSSENESIKKQLEDRRIIIDNAGSIADASLHLNGIFEAAENAAQEYVDNLKLYAERQEAITLEVESKVHEKTDSLIAEAEEKAESILSDARNSADRIIIDSEKRAKMQEANTAKLCEEMIRNAQKESESYWNRVSAKLDEYLSEHPELRNAISENKLKLN